MVEVYLHNIGNCSNEFESAKDLKSLFEKELSNYDGKIWLIPSVDIRPGTGYHDLDVLMMGYLEGYYQDILSFDDIEVKSFCTTIEIKSHGADGIHKNGQILIVDYPDGPHNVTTQSNGQNTSLKRFLGEALQMNKRTPHVTNIIWLTGINYDDFERSVGLINSNIITSDATIDEIFIAIGRQHSLKNQGYVDAFKGYDRKGIEHVANIFCAKSNGVDTMSLRRLNIFQKNNKFLGNLENNPNPVIVISGHAGTGKTMILLQAADYLIKKGHRCLFLTYNTALISDLKHTLRCMPQNISDIPMETMHSFMLSVLYQNNLWNNTSDIEKDFFPAVQTLLRAKEHIRYKNNYEFVFIDEAQDWEKPIPEVLRHLFKKSHIIIADGIDQFMRASEHAEWGNPVMPKLKKCLRQRHNLTVFAKLFANKMGVYWDVEPNKDFPGGRVLICNKYNEHIHNDLLSTAKKHGCVEYDMMLLAPKSLTTTGKFDLLDRYAQKGIHLYDGIDKQKRDQIYGPNNAKNEESRVYTYESCRGLEAWTTVCLRFDELFTMKHAHDYHEIDYTMARSYMLTLWTLIPLTRAIDTLVLIVKEDSYIAKIIDEIKTENPDLFIP